MYKIQIKKKNIIGKGSSYSVSNKLNALRVKDQGKVNAVTTYTVIYDDLPKLLVTGFAIRDPNLYVHVYNDGINEDGNEITEYYTNRIIKNGGL